LQAYGETPRQENAMKLSTRAAAISLATVLAGALAACDRNRPTPTPAPKTSAATPSAATGGTTSPGDSKPVQSSVNNGAGNREDNRNSGAPVSQQVDPNHAEQHRDFQQSGDAAGPKSADTAPMTRNK
jgi:hypothetical protein